MKEFWNKYKGAIIGGIIAILILATDLVDTLFALFIIFVAICLGNYVQNNKEEVKEKLKNFVDRM